MQQAINDLGYTPVQTASRRSNVGTIGLLLRNVTSPYYAQLFSDLQALAARDEVRIVAATGNMVPGSELPQLTSLLEMGVDGLIIGSGLMAPSAIARIAAEIPTVVVSRPAANTAASAVYDDPELIAHYIVDSLWSHGHRSVLLVDHPRAYSARPRTEAIRRIAANRGLHVVGIKGGYETSFGRAAVDTWWDLRHQHTAIITLSLLAALGFLETLDERGMEAPRDASVVSADSGMLVMPLRHDVTGFHRDSDALAATVWREITRRTQGSDDPRELRVDGTWHDGKTLGSVG